MTIIVPEIPPSLNRYAGRKNEWEYRSEKARWKELIAWLAKKDMPAKPYKTATVRITYYFPNGIRRDPDNYAGKMILDGLTAGGVIVDDSFNCIRLVLDGQIDRESPRTEITVTEGKCYVNLCERKSTEDPD